MAYVPLLLPAPVSAFQSEVTDLIDPLFSDIHTMLRLPIAEDDGLSAGCNLTCALSLLSIIAGISSKMMHSGLPASRSRKVGARFFECVERYFPWDMEPQNPVDGLRAVSGREAAKALYDAYRNPLAHALGRQEANNLGTIKVAKAPLTEAQIEEIERSTTRPKYPPTLGADDVNAPVRTKTVLYVPVFYWGVRQTVIRALQARPTNVVHAGGLRTMSTLPAQVTTTVAPVWRVGSLGANVPPKTK